MILEFVNAWDERKDELKKVFLEDHPEGYGDILEKLISVVINPEQKDDLPSSSGIKELDFGDYNGVLVFVIPGDNNVYPSTFWATSVGYGSCSVCDTFEGIASDSDYDENDNLTKPTNKQADDYMTLALHMLQGLKEI